MILRTGDMWTDSHADVILVTGNATVNAAGRLVMGRGAAAEAAVRFPGCAKVFGGELLKIRQQPPSASLNFKLSPADLVEMGSRPYGVLIHPTQFDPMLGVFQVKNDWAKPAVPKLIYISVDQLSDLAETEWVGMRIALNFPGIGNGRLRREVVLPLIQGLPDNVSVWEKPA